LLESIMSSHIIDGNAAPQPHERGQTDCRGQEAVFRRVPPGWPHHVQDIADVDEPDMIAPRADEVRVFVIFAVAVATTVFPPAPAAPTCAGNCAYTSRRFSRALNFWHAIRF
jgi:hypothetical protein